MTTEEQTKQNFVDRGKLIIPILIQMRQGALLQCQYIAERH